MSTYAIAEQLGASQVQVRRDLESSIVPPVTIEHQQPAPADVALPIITSRQKEVLAYIRAHGPVDDKSLVAHFDGNLGIETRRVELLKVA